MPRVPLVRLAEVKRGGLCRIPGDQNPVRVWKRRTGGFVEWVDHEAVTHSYLTGINALVEPVNGLITKV